MSEDVNEAGQPRSWRPFPTTAEADAWARAHGVTLRAPSTEEMRESRKIMDAAPCVPTPDAPTTRQMRRRMLRAAAKGKR